MNENLRSVSGYCFEAVIIISISRTSEVEKVKKTLGEKVDVKVGKGSNSVSVNFRITKVIFLSE